MSALIPLIAASVVGDIGALIAQTVFAFALLLIAIWGQISQGNRALKMGQDIAFGFFALFIWFIGVAQMIAGQVSGLALVIVTILMGTALFDPIRKVTWARILPIDAESRMHMLGLVCLLFAIAVFFLTSASVADPIGTPTDRASVYDPGQPRPASGIAWTGFDPLPSPAQEYGRRRGRQHALRRRRRGCEWPDEQRARLRYRPARSAGGGQRPRSGRRKRRCPSRAPISPSPCWMARSTRSAASGTAHPSRPPALRPGDGCVERPAAFAGRRGRTSRRRARAANSTSSAARRSRATPSQRPGLATVSVYDPATRQWSAAAPLPTARLGSRPSRSGATSTRSAGSRTARA